VKNRSVMDVTDPFFSARLLPGRRCVFEPGHFVGGAVAARSIRCPLVYALTMPDNRTILHVALSHCCIAMASSELGQMRERRLSCRQVSSTPSCGHASTLRRPAMPSRSPPYFSRRAPSRASAGGPYRYPGRQAWPSCLFQCPSRAPGGPAPSCRVQHPDDRVCGGQFLPCW
jgi:hypothetical protein